MRHLIVPSRETSNWREKLSQKNWLSNGNGIHNLGDYRGIPLSQNAPSKIDDLEIREMEPIRPGPQKWTERLDQQIFQSYEKYWPMSHDRIGDLIIVKLPKQISQFSEEIGNAMLSQYPSARVICADNGVIGQFRVRDLDIIGTRGDKATKTKVKENGNEFWTDPALVYYSPRLATERAENLDVAKNLSERLGRKISVCDPYAGVGPAVVALSKMKTIVGDIYANDLNPNASQFLTANLPGRKVHSIDARNLAAIIPECCDMLLVNLPHDSIEHLPDLVGLLRRGHEVVIRGWAILASDDLHISKETIRQHLSETEILSLEITPKKSYSATQEYVSIQAHIIRH